ncbi:MAG TPA: PEP-CTERM sorting domain-containing protein [Bryobacteraceae bacterium]|nr:PEP-CTERM sorting domain-containing protein [Bryobacteraceae bacterium]
MHNKSGASIRGIARLLMISGAFLTAGQAATVSLDWTQANPQWTLLWGGNSAEARLNVDPNNPGNDVTVRISLSGASFNGTSPTVGANGLSISLNTFSTDAYATVSFDFHYSNGVRDLRFTTNDIDRNSVGQMEELRALYTSLGGGAREALNIQVSPTSSALALYGSGLGQSLIGMNPASNPMESNATLTMVKSLDYLSMTYGLRTSWYSGAGVSDFNIGNFTWQTASAAPPPPAPPVFMPPAGNLALDGNPEPSTWLLLATGAGALLWRHRRKIKSDRS